MIEKTTKLILPIFIYLFYGNTAWACPACAGSMENPNSGKIFWILLAFIILAYIPGYIVFKTIYKNRHGNLPKPE